ncbi:MAG: hypothetical protein JWP43_411 [Ramlibacter sp.]|nr:hypothetical protein [Ramlibacter sp.]
MRIPYLLAACLPALARIIGLLTCAAVLVGCSAIKLGYNNLDEFAYWWLDRYLDFNEDQSRRVREDLARLQQWHRREELPGIGIILQRMEQLAPDEVSAAQACSFVPQWRDRLNALADRAEPAVVTLAMALTPDQLVHLERTYQKKIAEYRGEWVDLTQAELWDKRTRQFRERSEMIYGRLDEPQRAVMRQRVERSIFDASRLLAERKRRQQDALQTLRKVAGQPVSLAEARALVHGLIQRSIDPPEPAARKYQDALIEEGCGNLSALHNSTSAEQRLSAARRLRAYQRDLRELTAGQ